MNHESPFLFGVDVLAIVILTLQFVGFLLKAREIPLRTALLGLAITAVCFLAVASCAGKPERPTQVKDPCISTLEAFCARGTACGLFAYQSCVSGGISACAEVSGITAAEADSCSMAVLRAPCDDMVPRECIGIANPQPPPIRVELPSPQPETRDL